MRCPARSSTMLRIYEVFTRVHERSETRALAEAIHLSLAMEVNTISNFLAGQLPSSYASSRQAAGGGWLTNDG